VHGPLDDRGGGAVPAEERPPLVDVDDRRGELLARRRPVGDADAELERPAAVLDDPALDRHGGPHRHRHLDPGDQPGEEQAVVGDVEHADPVARQVDGGPAGREREEDEARRSAALGLVDPRPHRGEVRAAVVGAGRDDAFEDQGHAMADATRPRGRGGGFGEEDSSTGSWQAVAQGIGRRMRPTATRETLGVSRGRHSGQRPRRALSTDR